METRTGLPLALAALVPLHPLLSEAYKTFFYVLIILPVALFVTLGAVAQGTGSNVLDILYCFSFLRLISPVNLYKVFISPDKFEWGFTLEYLGKFIMSMTSLLAYSAVVTTICKPPVAYESRNRKDCLYRSRSVCQESYLSQLYIIPLSLYAMADYLAIVRQRFEVLNDWIIHRKAESFLRAQFPSLFDIREDGFVNILVGLAAFGLLVPLMVNIWYLPARVIDAWNFLKDSIRVSPVYHDSVNSFWWHPRDTNLDIIIWHPLYKTRVYHSSLVDRVRWADDFGLSLTTTVTDFYFGGSDGGDSDNGSDNGNNSDDSTGTAILDEEYGETSFVRETVVTHSLYTPFRPPIAEAPHVVPRDDTELSKERSS